MNPAMYGWRERDKVLWTVIQFVVIDMVDMISSGDGAKHLFGYPPMDRHPSLLVGIVEFTVAIGKAYVRHETS